MSQSAVKIRAVSITFLQLISQQTQKIIPCVLRSVSLYKNVRPTVGNMNREENRVKRADYMRNFPMQGLKEEPWYESNRQIITSIVEERSVDPK